MLTPPTTSCSSFRLPIDLGCSFFLMNRTAGRRPVVSLASALLLVSMRAITSTMPCSPPKLWSNSFDLLSNRLALVLAFGLRRRRPAELQLEARLLGEAPRALVAFRGGGGVRSERDFVEIVIEMAVSQISATLYAESVSCTHDSTRRGHATRLAGVRRYVEGCGVLFRANDSVVSYLDFAWGLADILLPRKYLIHVHVEPSTFFKGWVYRISL